MREIKLRAWDVFLKTMVTDSVDCYASFLANGEVSNASLYGCYLMQYTGLKDKNGMGLTEVYEGDIIDENGVIKGNIYEMDKGETDIVIPQLGTKAWDSAYKEAVVRGFDYSE